MWSHFENVIAQGAQKYQVLDHDEPVSFQLQVDNTLQKKQSIPLWILITIIIVIIQQEEMTLEAFGELLGQARGGGGRIRSRAPSFCMT